MGPGSHPPTASPPSTTGPPPEGPTRPAPSPTTGRRPSREERLSLAWLCSITSTETWANGTMLLATTRSRSSARMWRATSPSPGRPSPTSGSPERAREAATQQHYLFIYLENYFCVITWKLFKRLGYYQTKIDHFDASLCCLSVSCRCEKD